MVRRSKGGIGDIGNGGRPKGGIGGIGGIGDIGNGGKSSGTGGGFDPSNLDLPSTTRRNDGQIDSGQIDSRRRDGMDPDGKIGNKKTTRKKVTEFCSKNKKTCIGGAAGLGFAAYVGKTYKDLKEEEKECLTQCYPSNWAEYADGTESEPKYKTRLDFSEIEDEEVLEGIEENLCNVENLELNKIEEGKKACDTFCEASCKVTLKDAMKKAASDAGGAAGDFSQFGGDMFKDMLESFLKSIGLDIETLKKYAMMFCIGIVVLCGLSVVLKMKAMVG